MFKVVDLQFSHYCSKHANVGMSVHGNQNTVANESIPYAYDFAPQKNNLAIKGLYKNQKFQIFSHFPT